MSSASAAAPRRRTCWRVAVDPSPVFELLAHVGDQCAVHADQRVSDDVRTRVAGASAGLVGDQPRQRVGVADEDLLLAREQRRAGGDHPGDRDQLLGARFVLDGEEATRLEDEIAEGRDDGLALVVISVS